MSSMCAIIIDSLIRFKKTVIPGEKDLVNKFFEYLKKDLGNFEILVNVKMFDTENENTEFRDYMISRYENNELEDDYTTPQYYYEHIVLIKQSISSASTMAISSASTMTISSPSDIKLININFIINRYNYYKSFMKCTPAIEVYDSVKLLLDHNCCNSIYDVLYENKN